MKCIIKLEQIIREIGEEDCRMDFYYRFIIMKNPIEEFVHREA